MLPLPVALLRFIMQPLQPRADRAAVKFDVLLDGAGVEPRAYLGEAARRAIRSPGAGTLARDLK